jgi:transposase-like protein
MKRCKLTKKEYAAKNQKKARYLCKKCSRSAKSKDKLCKPEKIS